MNAGKTRNVRARNPGGLAAGRRRDGTWTTQPWKGLETIEGDGLLVFIGTPFAIRAMAKTLIIYQTRYGAETIADAMERWTQPDEVHGHSRDPEHWAAFVAGRAGRAPDERVDWIVDRALLATMIQAIFEKENGTDAVSHITWREIWSVAAVV